MKNILEVCVDSPLSIRNAIAGGADRIELCSSLILGGLTPSFGLAEFAVNFASIPCYALIRPRNGNFVFSEDEIKIMEQDIKQLTKIGVSGFVIGALTHSGNIDVNATKRLIAAANGADITFHRGFDLVKDPFQALEVLISLKVKRILTSGQQSDALKGVELIAKLQQKAGQQLAIMAGAGVNASNAKVIVEQAKIVEIHASCKAIFQQNEANAKVAMGTDSNFDSMLFISETEQVAAIKKAIS